MASSEAFQYHEIGLHIDLACSNVDIIEERERVSGSGLSASLIDLMIWVFVEKYECFFTWKNKMEMKSMCIALWKKITKEKKVLGVRLYIQCVYIYTLIILKHKI